MVADAITPGMVQLFDNFRTDPATGGQYTLVGVVAARHCQQGHNKQ